MDPRAPARFGPADVLHGMRDVSGVLTCGRGLRDRDEPVLLAVPDPLIPILTQLLRPTTAPHDLPLAADSRAGP